MQTACTESSSNSQVLRWPAHFPEEQ